MIERIILKNFRSYRDGAFEFSPGVNIIVGPNASGKTNLLEAVLVMARGSSYRAKDRDLIAFTKPWARIDAKLLGGHARTIKIRAEELKSYEFDGKAYSRISHQHTLPLVLFEPNNLMLLAGQPEFRRTFLDDLLEQLEPGYKTARRHYKRALSQRNALLKLKPSNFKEQIFAWDLRLSELGGYIARQRSNLAKELNKQLGGLYASMSGDKQKVSAEYQTHLPVETYETTLLKKLESSIDHDMVRGFTSFGPHREDLLIKFGKVPAGLKASRGETRTVLLALKVFELGVINRITGKQPILLLDDVFSELDETRRKLLTQHVSNYQTLITTTNADLVSRYGVKKNMSTINL